MNPPISDEDLAQWREEMQERYAAGTVPDGWRASLEALPHWAWRSKPGSCGPAAPSDSPAARSWE